MFDLLNCFSLLVGNYLGTDPLVYSDSSKRKSDAVCESLIILFRDVSTL